MTNEERIRKLRDEVESLRTLLDRTAKRRVERPDDEGEKTVLPRRKSKSRPSPAKEEEIPPF